MRKFPAFMVDAQVGTDRKLRRLEPGERWAFVAGVLALAAESPVRGSLLIAVGEPVDAHDVAGQASVDLHVAEGCLAKLRQLGIIEPDPGNDCERVHNWSRWNPPPRPSDSREAMRDRKRKQRERERLAKARQDEPAAQAASPAPTPVPSPPPRTRRRRSQGRPQTPPVALDVHPATPPERAAGRIAEAIATVVGRTPEAEVWLHGAHVHRVDAGTVLVGVQPEHVGWVNDRICPALADEAGHPVRAVACGEVAA